MGEKPMQDRWLLDERTIDSAVLREATEKLNFIWRLADAYRAPEHLEWLDLITGKLLERREFVRSHLQPRRSPAVA
jgi:hypothetical protein